MNKIWSVVVTINKKHGKDGSIADMDYRLYKRFGK